ncbi:hypothetical protein T265_06993 [Opisthorchis viverrini]|uniref:Uncharacterized protein n=1 Tax=Opisthorchis viverrini TaxID=6198 RepID=A0A074ZE94_OPIVI|nr:hypothetical protein T265_06993 [Opisthorchis viverrini]KER25591.1 hypothetical protein T265_06993 [Opisthorchis viverrini]
MYDDSAQASTSHQSGRNFHTILVTAGTSCEEQSNPTEFITRTEILMECLCSQIISAELNSQANGGHMTSAADQVYN